MRPFCFLHHMLPGEGRKGTPSLAFSWTSSLAIDGCWLALETGAWALPCATWLELVSPARGRNGIMKNKKYTLVCSKHLMEVSNARCDSGGTAAGSLPTEGTASRRNCWMHVSDFRCSLPAVPGQASTVNLNFPRLNKPHKGRSGSQHHLMNHPDAAAAQQRTKWGEVGALGRYCCHQTPVHITTASGVLCTVFGQSDTTLSMYPSKLKDSIFSGTLFSPAVVLVSVPHIPTFCLSQNLAPCISPSPVFSVPMPSSAFTSNSVCPAHSKQSSCHACWSGSGPTPQAHTLTLGSSFFPLALLKPAAAHTSGLTHFYLKPLHSRSTSMISLKTILRNTHKRITSSIYGPVSLGLGQVSAGSIRKAASGTEQLQRQIHVTPPVTAKTRELGRVGEEDGKKCA